MDAQVRISVQEADFDLTAEYAALRHGEQIGAIVSFCGLVRGWDGGVAMRLEHYPGMTERALLQIAHQAQARWPLTGITIIHRVGELHPGAQIVLVLTASAHRRAAYQANEFIMDYLKTEAPFWKQEVDATGGHWVDARETDQRARQRWEAEYDG
ncbi:molybdopterin synthase catalytic subunit MoaE [Amantichitinum ursilacus]|uniref:Molybdopterin synthase catalytic subunit n=1 Tax=Amantichitinum ursilacus TaxID=857265 RepID=A0A0N0GL17_9NEIS|nr:molybdopterin synthase catalytic subunit MoaE [Amantichitinum ursilacus]KPC49365.1 Molybdopterin synthase catalytic subunit [Amantichitinum ursilacus]